MIESKEEILKLEAFLEELKVKSTQNQGNIDNMIKYFEEERLKKDLISKDITETRVRIASYQQEEKSIEDTIEKYESDIKKLYEDIELKKAEHEKSIEDVQTIKNNYNQLIEGKNILDSQLLEYEMKLNEIKGDKNNYMQSFYTEQEKLKEMNRVISDLQKSVSTLEIKQEKYNMQIENYNSKLWDDYEMSYQMAQKFKREIENITKVQSEIKDLKNQIKELGNVNIDSIEEYKKVKERYEFMQSQREDLSQAKESLNVVIKDMEIKMKEQFLENFYIIKNNFIEVFAKLFGGGKADVFLEDDENILTSGIEIIAQPPGKKLQSLSLLSGGERALTAIALLFAILKTKPTPFCILDEIEAALDDANVFRYADYLKEFSDNTQFIVITHRKGTMESVDSLYGVTMEEEGVSKLVSVKLSDKLTEKAS